MIVAGEAQFPEYGLQEMLAQCGSGLYARPDKL
jgi:hypothetical protein